MRSFRYLLVAAAAVAALAATALPVGAGQLVEIDQDAVCNTATGEYDVTITITALSLGGEITISNFQVDGQDETPPEFTPNPIPDEGTSVAAFSIPGDSTSYVLEGLVSSEQFEIPFTLESTLDGDCEAIPTTTTTTSTSTTVAPTSTTAPAARAVAATPAFTG